MIDFNKLSQVNVNEIDPEKIIRAIIEHQNTIIKVILVVVSLVLLFNMFNDHHQKEQLLRTQMSQAQDKLAAMKARDASQQDLSNYQSSLPARLNEFDLIDLISKDAKSTHIIIPSLSPSQSNDMGLYDEIDFNFQAQAEDFRDMVLFLRKIERSKYPIMVDSWTGQVDNKGDTVFNISISAVQIHS